MNGAVRRPFFMSPQQPPLRQTSTPPFVGSGPPMMYTVMPPPPNQVVELFTVSDTAPLPYRPGPVLSYVTADSPSMVQMMPRHTFPMPVSTSACEIQSVVKSASSSFAATRGQNSPGSRLQSICDVLTGDVQGVVASKQSSASGNRYGSKVGRQPHGSKNKQPRDSKPSPLPTSAAALHPLLPSSLANTTRSTSVCSPSSFSMVVSISATDLGIGSSAASSLPDNCQTSSISSSHSSLSASAASFLPKKFDSSHRLPAPKYWQSDVTDVTGIVKGRDSGSEVAGTNLGHTEDSVTKDGAMWNPELSEPLESSSSFCSAASSLSTCSSSIHPLVCTETSPPKPMGRGQGQYFLSHIFQFVLCLMSLKSSVH